MNGFQEIAKWFAERDNGEFGALPRVVPYSVIGPTRFTRTVLYTTKPLCILSRENSDAALANIAIVGRGSLPTEDDIVWLREFARDRDICFLGDADPVDLLIFVWLRSRLALRYAGICDGLLSRIGVSWDDRLAIPLSESETNAILLLTKVCPEFRDLIGPQCAKLVDRARKLELEAVTIFARVDARTLINALAR